MADLPQHRERLTQILVFQCVEDNRVEVIWTCANGIIKFGAGCDLRNHVIHWLHLERSQLSFREVESEILKSSFLIQRQCGKSGKPR